MTNDQPKSHTYLDGEVNSDVSYCRGTDALVRYHVLEGVTCHQCGSGEVYQPAQAMDMPMVLSCLRCGTTAPSSDFDRVGDHDE